MSHFFTLWTESSRRGATSFYALDMYTTAKKFEFSFNISIERLFTAGSQIPHEFQTHSNVLTASVCKFNTNKLYYLCYHIRKIYFIRIARTDICRRCGFVPLFSMYFTASHNIDSIRASALFTPCFFRFRKCWWFHWFQHSTTTAEDILIRHTIQRWYHHVSLLIKFSSWCCSHNV